MMTRCIRPRGGPLWPLALPMIPYMRANLARKRSGLAAADAIVAVSTTIASDLRARAPEIAATRLEIIPNPVDVAGLRASAAADGAAHRRVRTRSTSASSRPTRAPRTSSTSSNARASTGRSSIVGDGPDRADDRGAGRRVRARHPASSDGSIRPQTTAWLAHASLLVFPSRGPESLSRVLLEASALGVPIAAMNTGGTPDIVKHGETGLLSSTPEALADDVRRLVENEPLRRQLGTAASAHAERTFDTRAVVQAIESLYLAVLKSANRRPVR